ncbi:hypothetical protein Peur_025051 [Populus x canadensis]
MAASKLEFRTEKCPHCKNDITGDSTSIRNHKIRCKGADVTKDRGWLESSQDAGKSTGADKKDNSGADQKHKSGADQK